ncbi:2989_t:CDS:2 [Ambispora leptoticha]|uniref:2989_t:CDS:1 n=1 Tax=Ambispora leptoticha TaxID=144679 RepID=A0A9N9GYQ1_9GLOM|nr:2989_t:CDS:2 [Ambispora leptoticha]
MSIAASRYDESGIYRNENKAIASVNKLVYWKRASRRYLVVWYTGREHPGVGIISQRASYNDYPATSNPNIGPGLTIRAQTVNCANEQNFTTREWTKETDNGQLAFITQVGAAGAWGQDEVWRRRVVDT